MDDILKVTGLNKSYDNFSLKDVSFTLPEGCITGFIGVNGAGKTTTPTIYIRAYQSYFWSYQFFWYGH